MRKRSKIAIVSNLTALLLLIAGVAFAIHYIFAATPIDTTPLLTDLLGIMFSVIFITTSLLAALSNKDDIVYYVNAMEYILINPPIFNFYGLSVISFIALVVATVSTITINVVLFWISFVIGIGSIIVLFFKMTTVYFRRDHIKKNLKKALYKNIKGGRIQEAESQIAKLYLNSLNSLDKRNFDICVENLEFLQELRKNPSIGAHALEVVENLLVQLSTNDLFYFERIIELFQSNGKESFLQIPSIRHYVAKLLVEKVRNENDVVTLRELYSRYTKETVSVIEKESLQVIEAIIAERKELGQRTEEFLSSEKIKHYKAYFADVYEKIAYELDLLAEVMIFYETIDVDWVSRMDEICGLPAVLNELWLLQNEIDYIDNPFKNILRGNKHFVEYYIMHALKNGKPLKYVHILKERSREEELSKTEDDSQKYAFSQIANWLICDPFYPNRDMDRVTKWLKVGHQKGEFTIGDYVCKGICEMLIASKEREESKMLVRLLDDNSCYYDIVSREEEDVDESDENENIAVAKMKNAFIWLLQQMMSYRNSVGICVVLKRICSDISDYGYYFYPETLCFDAQENYNILWKVKNYYQVCDPLLKDEMKVYLDMLETSFINPFDM